MITALETQTDGKSTLDLLSPEVRKTIEVSMEILDHAALLRASGWRHEDAIREWEIRVKGRSPKGREWKSLLRDCLEAVAEAGELLTRVHVKEQEALPHMKAAVAKLRTLASRTERMLPDHTIGNLERCADLRQESIEKLDEALRLSFSLTELRSVSLPGVLDLLEERRRLLGEAQALRAEADTLERVAFLPADAGSAPDFERRIAASLTAERVDPEERVELEEEDWEDWLLTIQEDDGQTIVWDLPNEEAAPAESPADGTAFGRIESILGELKRTALSAERRLESAERRAEQRILAVRREAEDAVRQAEERIRSAEAERDEALGLVGSLTRRLEGVAPAEAPVADAPGQEIVTMREAISHHADELNGLKDLVSSLHAELRNSRIEE